MPKHSVMTRMLEMKGARHRSLTLTFDTLLKLAACLILTVFFRFANRLVDDVPRLDKASILKLRPAQICMVSWLLCQNIAK